MRSPGRAGIALDDASLDGVAGPDAFDAAFLAVLVTLTSFAVAFFAGAFLAGMRRLLKLAVPLRLRPSSGSGGNRAREAQVADVEGPCDFVEQIVLMVQSVHMFEHVLQLIQVTLWHVPDDEAFGLLGCVFQLQGSEEWLQGSATPLLV